MHFLYSELYKSSIEESIVYQGQRTASHYHYGELSDEIIGKIQWYNIVSEYEIIVVDQLEALTSYFPYEINYQTLIGPEDRQKLAQGKYIMKEGYVKEFDREVLGAVFPIKGEGELIGFIYIYVPLAAIQDVFKQSIPLLAGVGTLFFIILFFALNRVWKSMFKPLKELQQASEEISKGNYATSIPLVRDDEVGQLTSAFNQMAHSLEKQEERKKEFTSNIVHELRTPLTYIQGYAEVLKRSGTEQPEESKKYLATIQKETERLNKLINDLVELDNLQENAYAANIEPIAVSQLLIDTLSFFDIHRKEKEIELALQVDESCVIAGDPKRIHQVFYNTIDNALKYATPKSIMTISLQKSGDNVQYAIQNEGTTIQQEDLVRIGERFFRTDKARNRTTGGTGLGLSIVKEIVRVHGGTFNITSSPSEGTVVRIELPGMESEEV